MFHVCTKGQGHTQLKVQGASSRPHNMSMDLTEDTGIRGSKTGTCSES